MTADQVKRKLAAILSADVKGYSRLMGEDEEGTIRALKGHLEVISRFIAQHQGRVVGTGGDSVLAEFASVVDAVRCAVAIQGELPEKNKDLAADRRLEFRIGVNLGDVVDEGDTILGDGVNIAARLESHAAPGGICISGTAFDQVKNKLNLGYKFLGEQKVKNIKEPVRVYQVLMDPESAGKLMGDKKGRLEESVSEYKKALQRAPKNIFAYIGLVDSYIRMEKEEEARAAAAEVLRIDPKFSLDSYAKRSAHMKYVDRHIESLRKAGLK